MNKAASNSVFALFVVGIIALAQVKRDEPVSARSPEPNVQRQGAVEVSTGSMEGPSALTSVRTQAGRVPADGAPTEVEVATAPDVRGCITFSGLPPMVGVPLTLTVEDKATAGAHEFWTTSDAQGVFAFYLPEGLELRGRGRIRQQLSPRLGQPSRMIAIGNGPVDIDLESAIVNVEVRNSDGDPAAFAFVQVDPVGHAQSTKEVLVCDELGRAFSFMAEQEILTLRALDQRSGERGIVASLDTRMLAPLSPVSIHLSPPMSTGAGALRIAVNGPNGRSLSHFAVDLRSGSLTRRVHSKGDADHVRVDGLPAGTYAVTLVPRTLAPRGLYDVTSCSPSTVTVKSGVAAECALSASKLNLGIAIQSSTDRSAGARLAHVSDSRERVIDLRRFTLNGGYRSSGLVEQPGDYFASIPAEWAEEGELEIIYATGKRVRLAAADLKVGAWSEFGL